MRKRDRLYGKIVVDGNTQYVERVEARLEEIKRVPDGKLLCEMICLNPFQVTIRAPKNKNDGNSCGPTGYDPYDGFPPLTVAILKEDQELFLRELKKTVAEAKRVGLLEHLVRQLAIGLSPATYRLENNVAPPRPKVNVPTGAAPPLGLGPLVAADLAQRGLQELLSGKRPVDDLPAGWGYDLPRLMRAFLTPGAGAPSVVSFDPDKTMHCRDNPAMHERPPAIGLAHEMIHALHNSRGVNMGFVKRGKYKLEEIITTGFPPYESERLSDNKMRTQWPTELLVRTRY